MYNLGLKNNIYDFFRDAERQRVDGTDRVCVKTELF